MEATLEPSSDLRLLILAPVGRDAELLRRLAESNGLTAVVCPSVQGCSECLEEGAGAVILTEEALHLESVGELTAAAGRQPSWSEVPFVVLAGRVDSDARVRKTAELIRPLRNVMLIERPIRPATLLSALEAALRDRKRQYEVRDTLDALRQSQEQLQWNEQLLETRVRQRTGELLAANREMEGFTYSVSHDLRAPLRAIVSTSRILLEETNGRLDEEHRDLLERQALNANKLGVLIDDLLKMSRLAREQMAHGRIDMSALASEVIEELLGRFDGPDFQVEVMPGLVAFADERLVRLALQNLLENALKFSPAGGKVTVGATCNGGPTVFFVRDEGIGFDQQYAPKLFLPFERLHLESEYPGTGIGLANVQRIVERHGGKVWAEGRPGEGAVFYFTLEPERADPEHAKPGERPPSDCSR